MTKCPALNPQVRNVELAIAIGILPSGVPFSPTGLPKFGKLFREHVQSCFMIKAEKSR